MIFPTSDPIRDYERFDAEQSKQKLPVCDECGYEITDDAFYMFCGCKICEKCLDEHKRRTNDYLS